jgi:hypothetical protein
MTDLFGRLDPSVELPQGEKGRLVYLLERFAREMAMNDETLARFLNAIFAALAVSQGRMTTR